MNALRIIILVLSVVCLCCAVINLLMGSFFMAGWCFACAAYDFYLYFSS